MDLVLLALIGILAGALVNALADDLPEGRFPRRPRYVDGSPRPVSAWLGISAWLLRLWRGQGADSELPWRYPATELATAALLILTWKISGADESVAPGQLLIWQVHSTLFVLLALVDLERRRILLLPLAIAAILALVDASVTAFAPPNLSSALVGGLCGLGAFSLVYLGGISFGKLRGLERITVFGFGDVLVMGAAGLIVGFPNILAAMALAVILAGTAAMVHLAYRASSKREYQRFAAIAYAPYILAATWITMLSADEITRTVFDLPV